MKLNYDILGNELPHLHTHVVPRYTDDPKPGWPFPFPDGDPGRIDEDEFRHDLEALRGMSSTGSDPLGSDPSS